MLLNSQVNEESNGIRIHLSMDQRTYLPKFISIGSDPFNRAMLFNVGYMEAMKKHDFTCFVFHDVDLIPENDRNIYSCPTDPRHMSVAVDTMRYR